MKKLISKVIAVVLLVVGGSQSAGAAVRPTISAIVDNANSSFTLTVGDAYAGTVEEETAVHDVWTVLESGVASPWSRTFKRPPGIYVFRASSMLPTANTERTYSQPVQVIVRADIAPLTPLAIRGSVSKQLIQVCWDPDVAGGAVSYQILRDAIVLATIPAGTSDVRVCYNNTSNLVPGTTYTFNVIAISATGKVSGPGVLAVTYPPLAPVPAGLSAAVSGANINLNWILGSTNTYSLTRGASTWNFSNTVNSFVDTNVSPGVSYTYALRACNAVNECSAAASVSITPAAIPAPPSVTAKLNGVGVDVSWSSTGAVGYKVNGGSITTATSLRDTNLNASTRLTYSVTACNQNGLCSGASTASVDIPLAPRFEVSAVGSNTIQLLVTGVYTWRLEESLDGGNTWPNLVPLSGAGIISGAPVAFTFNRPGGSYKYRIQNTYPDGSTQIVTAPTVLLTGIPAPAQPVIKLAVGGGNLQVSWTDTAPAGGYYKFYVAGNLTTPTSRLSYTQAGVLGTTYSYWVQACNPTGECSNVVAVAYSYVLPASPSLKLPANSASDSFTLGWGKIDGLNNYLLYESFNGAAWVESSVDAAAVSKLLSGKANGTYSYKMVAVSPVGKSAESASVKIDVAALGSLGAVTATSNAADGTVNLTWPKVIGATEYQVQARLNGMNTGAVVKTTGLSLSMPAVSVAGTYSYLVAPRALVGSYTNVGSAVASNSVTFSAPASAPTFVAPTPTSSASGNYSFGWNPVANAQSYVVNENGVDLPKRITNPLTFSASGKSNATYTYKVKACNAVGCSTAYSSSISIDVVQVAPVTNLTATLVQNTGITTLEWTSNATSFQVQIKLNGVAQGSSIPVSSPRYSFPAVTVSGTYTYEVTACVKIGITTNCSSPSASNTVSPIEPASPTVSVPAISLNGSYTVSWTRSLWATHYKLYENGVQIQDSADWTKVFNALYRKNSGTYSYEVAACWVICSPKSYIALVTVTLPASVSVPLPLPISTADIKRSALLTDGNVNSPALADAPTGTPVGSIAGQFRVDEGGAANYTIPITIPDGVAGTKPQIAISYSSNLGNGMMGKGWNISGLGAVVRCRQTLFQDNQALPINWTSTDRFCLNGQRLQLKSGVYGAPSSTYKTEIDSYVLVTAVGGSSGNPDYFKAEAKDGSTTYYGAEGNDYSKVIGSSGTYSWGIHHFEDSVGNTIRYFYQEFMYQENPPSVRAVTSIFYAYPAAGPEGYSANTIIHFEYEDRPDKSTSYVAGLKLEQTQRLKEITVYNKLSENDGTQTLRTYNFDYLPERFDNRGAPQVSRLNSVTECSGTGACYKPTTFTWGGGSRETFSASLLTSPNYPSSNGKRRNIQNQVFGDFSGDGVQDVAYFVFTGTDSRDPDKGTMDLHVQYGLKNGVYYGSTNSTDVVLTSFSVGLTSTPKLAVLDYNADGRQDLAFLADNAKWYIFPSIPNASGGWALENRYQVSAANLPPPQGVSLSESTSDVVFMDINGDGLQDLVTSGYYKLLVRDTTKSTDSSQAYRFSSTQTAFSLNNPDEFGEKSSYTSSRDCTQTPDTFQLVTSSGMADFNGDGLADSLITVTHNYFCFIPEVGSRQPWSESLSYPVTISKDGKISRYGSLLIKDARLTQSAPILVDLNGDGLTDIVYKTGHTNNPNTQYTSYADQYSYQLNNGTGFNLAEDWKDVYVYAAAEYASQVQFIDINQDGKLDAVWGDSEGVKVKAWGYSYSPVLYTDASETSVSSSTQRMLMDMDGDGVLDYLRFTPENLTVTRGFFTAAGQPIRCASIPGVGIDRRCPIGQEFGDTFDVLPASMQNLNMIAITDGFGNNTLISYGTLAASTHYSPTEIQVGTTTVSPYCPAPVDCSYTLVTASDFYKRLNGGWDLPSGTKFVSFDANNSSPSITTTNTSKGKPVLELNGGLQIVTAVETKVPSAGTSPRSVSTATKKVDYYYIEGKLQAGGRGFLGFSRLKTIDSLTKVTTETVYRQDFPFQGSPQKTTVYSPNGSILSKSENTWDVNIVTAAETGRYRFQPYLSKAVEASYVQNSDGTVSSSPLQTVTTVNEMESGDNGNLRKITVTTQAGSDKLIKETTSNYFPSEWENRMGRLSDSTVVTTINNVKDTDRKVSFTYYPYGQGYGKPNGMLATETVWDSMGAEFLKTEHVYDQWGNKKRVITTGLAEPGRTESRSTTTLYDSANGRFVKYMANNKSHLTVVEARDPVTGQPTSVIDPNGVKAQVLYDAMGAEYLSQDATGAWKRTDKAYCTSSSNCPVGASFYVTTQFSGGGKSIAYFDSLGRAIRNSKVGFDGTWIHVETEYDSFGRVVRTSTPFSDGQEPAGWTTTEYDYLSRVTKVTLPDDSVTTQSYTGSETKVTNHLGQVRTESRNGLGQLLKVTDHLGGAVEYTYNTQGKLKTATTKEPNTKAPDTNAITVRICYDTLGRKIAMLDPDKGGWLSNQVNASVSTDVCSSLSASDPGWWRYTYNAFDELITQVDAKGQVTSMKYDILGRMIKRVDEDQTLWVYDKTLEGSTPAGAKGKLMAVIVRSGATSADITDCKGTDHCTQYFYDQNSRLTDTVVSPPNDKTVFASSITYDSIGRPYETRDSLNGAVFNDSGVQTQYNQYGYPYRTIDIAPVGGGDGVLGTVKKVNERGQTTEELRGNGATTYNTYNPKTGNLEHQYVTNALGFTIQDETYGWDTLGNLKYRQNKNANLGNTANKNLSESFCYDGLNRLTHVVPNQASLDPACGTPTVTYDGLGNIKTKAGVGTYTYGNNAGPHAVTSTTDGATYQYDKNGNMTGDTGTGRSFEYTQYDQVKRITKAGNSTSFSYVNHSRWKRVDVKAGVTTTTTYLDGVERIQSSSNSYIEWKRYVAGMVITYKTDAEGRLILNGSNKQYIYGDHLGSVDVTTDESGKVTNSMSFDPWGMRRGGEDWKTMTEAQRKTALTMPVTLFIQPITNRGFTGHEMVDDMGIIHMNGRIYDPRLGRFLQADPHVDGATDTQGYNRYAYVRNNPMNATDPSGFFSLRQWVGVIVAAVATVVLCITAACQGTPQIWMAIGAVSGAAQAAANGGNIIVGTLLGAMTGLAGGSGNYFAAAFVGGYASWAGGGKFGHGFLSAGVGAALGGASISGHGDLTEFFSGMAVSAFVGGSISEVTGGKFANGAATAAFSYAASWGARKAGESLVDENGTGSMPGVSDVQHEGSAKSRWKIFSKVRDGIADVEFIDEYKVKYFDEETKQKITKTISDKKELLDMYNKQERYKGLSFVHGETNSTTGHITIYRSAVIAWQGSYSYANPVDNVAITTKKLIFSEESMMKFTLGHEMAHRQKYESGAEFNGVPHTISNYYGRIACGRGCQ